MASYEVEVATVCFSVLGLHYTFATKFLVSLFDEKLSRREIDPTNFLQRSSRPPPPRGARLSAHGNLSKRGRDDENANPLNAVQFRVPTEFDSVNLGQGLTLRMFSATVA